MQSKKNADLTYRFTVWLEVPKNLEPEKTESPVFEYSVSTLSTPVFAPHPSVRLDFVENLLGLIPVFSHQPLDTRIIFHQIQNPPISPNRLHQTNSMRIHPLCILG